MTSVMRGRAFGRAFEVRVPEVARDGLVEALPWSWRPYDGKPERVWELEHSGDNFWAMVDGEVIGQWQDPTRALHYLLSDLELWVAGRAKARVFVHAGCAVVDGAAIVIPGRTHSGKTSLTAALVRAGAIYYSDEFTVLGADGRARPYARPLAIRAAAGELGVRTHVGELGGTAGASPVPVRLVAHLYYDASSGLVLTDVSPGRIVLALMDNTVPAQTRPRAAMTAVTAAAAGARGVTGTRGDADEAAARLITMLHR